MLSSQKNATLLMLLAGSAIGAAGCDGAGTGREGLSGSVTLDGKPLGQGSIDFLPVSGRGASCGAVFRDGKFDIEAEKGALPGTYQVQINGVGKTGRKIPSDEVPGEMMDEYVSVVPLRYNKHSELTREVVAGEENHFEFRLTKDASE